METLITIYIRANSAEAGPPLGTILGNLGINTVKFCKDFNEYTQGLPNYLKLSLKIVVKNIKRILSKLNYQVRGI